MRIIFTFTDDANLSRNTERKYNSTLVVPDSAYEPAEVKLKIMAIAELVALLSNVYVFVSCREVGIVRQLASDPAYNLHSGWQFDTCLLIAFQYFSLASKRTSKFSVISFQQLLLQPSQIGKRVSTLNHLNASTDLGAPILRELIGRILELGKAKSSSNEWQFVGYFSPYRDPSLFRQRKDIQKKQQKRQLEQQKELEEQQKALEKEALKRQKREEVVKARQLNPEAEPKTGTGRTVGARPGMFDGVMMRSQLEIRFAAELKERDIRWIYEGETLGAGGYLVDFYLPDLGVWVEVKGKFEARDKHLLPEVAEVLKARKQSLFVYTNSTCYKVNPSGLREIPHKNFWLEVVGG